MRWSARVPLVALAVACRAEAPTEPAASPGDGLASAPADASPAAATTTIVVLDHAGIVGHYTSLVSSASGRQHVTYYDVTNGNLKYATCGNACTSIGNWTTGAVDQAGVVGWQTSLEVASGGRRHVTYYDDTNRDLKYATCAPTSACTAAADWTRTRIDSAGSVGLGSSLALADGGGREVSYLKSGNRGGAYRELKYAVCLSACGQAGNWTRVVLEWMPLDNSLLGEVTSLSIGADGRRHISYFSPTSGDLKYATCLSGCTDAANWQKLTIDQAGYAGLHSSIAAGGDGILHVSYYDYTNGDLKYARCAFDCTTAANWQKAVVRGAGNTGRYTSLTVESNGRVHVSFTTQTGGALFYLTCNANCTTASSWMGAALDGIVFSAGRFSSLAVRAGVVRISYLDHSKGDLRYLERTP